jgi:hypothetical protein
LILYSDQPISTLMSSRVIIIIIGHSDRGHPTDITMYESSTTSLVPRETTISKQ